MNKKLQMILTILLILAVMGYTFYNYSTGKIEPMMMIVSVLILGWPLLNIVRGLINELRNK